MYRIVIILAVVLSSGILHAKDQDASKVESIKLGEKVFKTTCFACHGPNGKGLVPGTPDLTGSKSPLKQDSAVLKKRIIEGYQSAGSPLAMPPKGGNPQLTEAEVDAVIVYMKNTFLPKSK